MDGKKWYYSKTVWAGIITALVGAAQTIGLQFGFDLLTNPIASVILTILGALGVYGRVSATTSIK
jgi:uncharacterized membrane protein